MIRSHSVGRYPRMFALAASLAAWLMIGEGGGSARAEVIYQSAITLTEGPVGNSIGGVRTDTEFFSGVRFLLEQDAIAERIGGHFAQFSSPGNDQIFGALVSIPDGTATPDLDNDLIDSTLIDLPPDGVSANISGAVSAELTPGWYALVFGSGRFGATGETTAIQTNGSGPVNEGLDTTFAIRTRDNALSRQVEGARYFLEGRFTTTAIPEPSGLLMAGVGLGALGLALLRKRGRL